MNSILSVDILQKLSLYIKVHSIHLRTTEFEVSITNRWSKIILYYQLAPQDFETAINATRSNYISIANKFVAHAKDNDLLGSVQNIQKTCENFLLKSELDPSNTISGIISSCKNFVDNFNTLSTVGSDIDSFNFIEAAYEFFTAINKFESIIIALTQLQGDCIQEDERHEVLTIGLDNNVNRLPVLSDKICGIEICYNEIANCLYGEAITPLKLIKLETGSTWLKVLGNKVAIPILINVISNAAMYQYAEFVNHKKSVIFENIDIHELEKIIDLRSKIIGTGIATPNLDSSIEQHLSRIANALDKSIAGEPKVYVNDNVCSIKQEVRREFLNSFEQASIAKSRTKQD